MNLIQLLLPLDDNNKQPFPHEEFDRVGDELANRFGGITAFRRSPAEGVWREGQGDVSRDEVVIFEVMTGQLNREWWSGWYRKELENRFRQERLIIGANSSRASLNATKGVPKGSQTRPHEFPQQRQQPKPLEFRAKTVAMKLIIPERNPKACANRRLSPSLASPVVSLLTSGGRGMQT
jgi:hypothetical protein